MRIYTEYRFITQKYNENNNNMKYYADFQWVGYGFPEHVYDFHEQENIKLI